MIRCDYGNYICKNILKKKKKEERKFFGNIFIRSEVIFKFEGLSKNYISWAWLVTEMGEEERVGEGEVVGVGVGFNARLYKSRSPITPGECCSEKCCDSYKAYA